MNYINSSPNKAAITGLGAYVPKHKLTNADLEKMVDTNEEWIFARTGIKERRILTGQDSIRVLLSWQLKQLKTY